MVSDVEYLIMHYYSLFGARGSKQESKIGPMSDAVMTKTRRIGA